VSPASPPTDYLGRLVRRALGGTSAIGPRLPSVFEPPEAAMPPVVDPPTEPGAEESSLPRRLDSLTAEDGEPRRPLAGALEGKPDRVRHDAVAAENGHRPPEPRSDPGEPAPTPSNLRLTSTAIEESPRLEGRSEPVAGPRIEALQRAGVLAAPRRDGRRSPIAATADREVAAASAPSTFDAQVVALDGVGARPRADGADRLPRDDAGAAHVVGALVPPALTIFATPSHRAGKPSPPPPRASAPETDAPTVVNVTIGRVEVRAVPESAASASPPADPRHAPMSIDEYLRRRGGAR